MIEIIHRQEVYIIIDLCAIVAYGKTNAEGKAGNGCMILCLENERIGFDKAVHTCKANAHFQIHGSRHRIKSLHRAGKAQRRPVVLCHSASAEAKVEMGDQHISTGTYKKLLLADRNINGVSAGDMGALLFPQLGKAFPRVAQHSKQKDSEGNFVHKSINKSLLASKDCIFAVHFYSMKKNPESSDRNTSGENRTHKKDASRKPGAAGKSFKPEKSERKTYKKSDGGKKPFSRSAGKSTSDRSQSRSVRPGERADKNPRNTFRPRPDATSNTRERAEGAPAKRTWKERTERDDKRPVEKREDRDKKPFSRDRKPFPKRDDARTDKKTWSEKPGRRDEKHGDKAERSDRKPFSRDKKSFSDRDSEKGFKKSWKDRAERTPGAESEPGEKRERKPFSKERKAFSKGDKPFSKDKKPFRKRSDGDDNDRGRRAEREEAPTFSKGLPEVERNKKYYADSEAKEIGGAMTLNKYIAHSGECSRRDAAEMVKQGKVRVNGELILEPGYRVEPGDQVTLSGKKLTPSKNLVYILLNKPKGFITTTEDENDRKTVMELVANAEADRLFPVGRLDRNTTGVLLLTNDGALAHKLSHPSYNMKKVYHVTLDKNLTRADYEKIVKGLELEDGLVQVDELAYLENRKEVGVEIHSGKNRIVRRIFESLGYVVEKLDRVMYAGLTKKNVSRGKWRTLTEKEIIFLKHFKG